MKTKKYYIIKTRSDAEMNWWGRNQGKHPFKTYIDYKKITKWVNFKLLKNYNEKVENIYELYRTLLENVTEFHFYNSKEREYYTKDTPVSTFRLRKRKGGYREITVFSEEYKRMHELLLEIYEDFFPTFPDSTSAYIKGRGQRDTVNKHKHARVHLSLDLENFYPSIKEESLAEVLKKIAIVRANLTDKSIEMLAEMSTYDGSLAQGSAISPILSNIYSIPLDYEMYDLVKNTNITYTRYADDLSLSSPNLIALPSKKNLPDFVDSIQNTLDRIYGGNLKINKTKTKLQFNDQIKILGITIGRKENGMPRLSVGKTRKEEYSRELFQLLCDVSDGNVFEKMNEYQAVRGKMEYLVQFEPNWFDRLQIKLRRTFQFNGDVWDFILRKIDPEN